MLRRRYERPTIRYFAQRLKEGWTVERLITHFVTRPEYVAKARAALGDEPIVILGDGSELIHTTTQGDETSRVDVTGLAEGEQVLGIEWNHAQYPMWGITSQGRLLDIGPDGAAEAIGDPIPGLGSDGRPVGLGLVADGFQPPELEVVDGDTGYRLDRVTGAVIATYTFVYDEGDLNDGADPDVRAFGYRTGVAGELGAVTDRVYLDEATGSPVESFGGGILTSDHDPYQFGRGPLHVDGVVIDGYDRALTIEGVGYAVLDTPNSGLGLYQVEYSSEPRLISTLAEDEVLGLAVLAQA